MVKISAGLLAAAALLFAGCTAVPSVSDDFNSNGQPGQQPDSAKWQITPNRDADPSLHFIDTNGVLHMRAYCYDDAQSGSFCTQGTGKWDAAEIGSVSSLTPPFFVDVRAQVPAALNPDGRGAFVSPNWEANSYTQGGCDEVDATEYITPEPDTAQQSIHYWCQNAVRTNPSNCGVNLSQQFYDYWAYVAPDRVDFHVTDSSTGKELTACASTIYENQVATDGHQLNSPLWFFLSMENPHAWGGNPNVPAGTSVTMLIDYIHVSTP
jgi:hypothetical protein